MLCTEYSFAFLILPKILKYLTRIKPDPDNGDPGKISLVGGIYSYKVKLSMLKMEGICTVQNSLCILFLIACYKRGHSYWNFMYRYLVKLDRRLFIFKNAFGILFLERKICHE